MDSIRDNSVYKDRQMQYAIFGLILQPLYIMLMSQLSSIIPFPTTVTTMLYYGAIWICIAKYVFNNTKAFAYNTLHIGILLLFFSFSCYAVGGTGSAYIFQINFMQIVTFQPKTLFFTSMFMLLGISVRDFDSFSVRLHMISRVGVCLGFLIYFFSLLTGNKLYYDDMNYAYSLCLVVCCLIASYTKKDLPYIAVGALCLLLAGTRGPLVCITVAFLLKGFIGKKNAKVIIGRIALLIFTVVVLYSGALAWVLQKLLWLLEGFGITQLRILDYMNESMLMDSSGRNDLSQIIKSAIAKKPLLGYGIGADRTMLSAGRYCHNVVLELMVSLGVILGTAVLIWILSRFFKMLFSKNESYAVIAIAFFSGEFVKLFLSSSILYSTKLFIFLGISLAATGSFSWKSPARIDNGRTEYEG